MWKLSKHLTHNLLKNSAVIGYLILMAAAGWGLFMLEDQPEKSILALMQLTLLAVPLITMVFGTIYYYNSLEFIMLLLSQPVRRSAVMGSFFFSLSVVFAGSYLLALGPPLLLYHPVPASGFLLLIGVLLSVTFIAIALLVCSLTRDKSRGMGFTLLLWAFFAFIFDGLLLFLMYQFSHYPIERGVLALSFLNPLDLARILVMMQTDASALLGYSGAVFRNFFSHINGILLSTGALLVWAALPLLWARRRFAHKDL